MNAIKSGLNQEARKDLKERKLQKAEIDALEGFGYRSLPTELPSRRQVGRAVQDALQLHDVSLLPFIDKTGAFCRISETPEGGILVPIRSVCSEFAAFKVRRNGVGKRDRGGRQRYSWFPGGSHEIHARVAVGARRIMVVEGPLGADIVFLLWAGVFGEDVSVIGLPSATSHAGLVEVLEEVTRAMGEADPEIGLCLDQDEAGQTGTESIKKLLDPTSLPASVVSWPGPADLPEFLAKSRNESRDLVKFAPVPKTQPVVSTRASLLPPTAFDTLGEARKALKSWMATQTRAASGISLSDAEMGVGKTHGLIQALNESREPVAVFTDRWEALQQFGETANWAFLEGVDRLCPENRRKTLLKPLLVVGYPIDSGCAACPDRPGCEYWKRRESASRIRAYHCSGLHDLRAIQDRRVVCFDDLDLEKALLKSSIIAWELVESALAWSEGDEGYAAMWPVLKALLVARLAIVAPNRPHERPRLTDVKLFVAMAKAIGGQDKLSAALLTAERETVLPPPSTGAPHSALLAVVKRLAIEMGRQHTGQGNPRVHLSNEGIILYQHSPLASEHLMGKRVIVTRRGGLAQLQRVFPGVEIDVFDGSVKMPDLTHITQYYDGALTRNKDRTREVENRAAELFRKRLLSHPAETPECWGFVGFKDTAERLRATFPGLRALHYGGQAGSNALEDVSFLVVAGDQFIHPVLFAEEAQAIWGDDTALDLTQGKTQETLRDQQGHEVRVPRRRYLDSRLDERWREITAGEVRQAMGRGRAWNTGNLGAVQGELWADGASNAAPPRSLDIALLCSFVLDGVVPHEIIGAETIEEGIAIDAALALGEAGKKVTQESLRVASGLSVWAVRKHLDKAKGASGASRRRVLEKL